MKMTALVLLFQLLSLSVNIRADLERNGTMWENIETFCPTQSCKFEEVSNRSRSCICDSNCFKFHDCCFDKIMQLKNVFKGELEIGSHDDRSQCIRTPSLGWALLVSSCPNETTFSRTDINRRLCTKVSNVRSHMLDIPVTSSITGLTYRNLHCAICNEDARHLISRKAWLKIDGRQGSRTPDPSLWSYEDGSLSWKVPEESSNAILFDDGRTDFYVFPSVNVLVSEQWPENSDEVGEDSEYMDLSKERILRDRDVKGSRRSVFLKKVRSALETGNEEGQSEIYRKDRYITQSRLFLDDEFIRQCPMSSMTSVCNQNIGHSEDDSATWCISYSMPVYTLTGKEGAERRIFRNPHCAICHGIEMENLKCLNIFQENKVRINEEAEGLMLLEFSFGDALNGDLRCGSRSVWDPVFKRCYFLDEKGETETNSSGNVEEEMKPTLPNMKVEVGRVAVDHLEDDYCTDTTLLTMSTVQWYLASAFFGVSIACLSLHVIIHACSGRSSDNFSNQLEKRQPSSISIERNHITNRSFHILAWLLVLDQILFIAGSRRSEIRVVCIAIAVIHSFLSLAAISWLSVFCLQVFQSFFSVNSIKSARSVDSNSKMPSLKLTIIAWLIPTIFSSLFLTLELIPGKIRSCLARGGACWYGDTVSFRILFILPALLMLAGDGCIFTAIIFGIREKGEAKSNTTTRVKHRSQLSRRRSSNVAYNDHRRFRLCARLGMLMAIAWSCAAAASLGGLTSFWYGFVLTSGLQGVFIFVSSGAKSKLTHIIWVKATGKPLTVGGESKNKKNNAKSDSTEATTVSIQK